MTTYDGRFEWELQYLSKNKKPADRSGKELSVLDYSGLELTDRHIQLLVSALLKNKVFQGPLYLSSNLITTMGVQYLTLLPKLPFTEIDLSYNSLTARAGAIIGDALASYGLLIHIKLTGCNVELDGVQRICENLPSNRSLKALDLGFVGDSGLQVITKYLPKALFLQNLAFQESANTTWRSDLKTNFIDSLKQATGLLECTINSDNLEAHSEFLNEVQRLTSINRTEFFDAEQNREAVMKAECSAYCTQLVQTIEDSIANMPVRVYLFHSLKTLLNDGIYELAKLRSKQSDERSNSAYNNIKWLVKFLLASSQ